MAEEVGPVIISENERKESIEKDVVYYMTIAPKPAFENKIKYTRTFVETFSDPIDQTNWELQEIDRCKNGWNGMPGKMYFYFNYGNILNVEIGKLPPEYRVADHEWFQFVEDQQNSKEFGVICVKRRRVGASWKESMDVLHDVLFRPFFKVGMNSKSENDSIELFKKVKFLYSNLPQFLRVRASASNTKMHMDFSYYVTDIDGNRIKKGNQSEITVVSPVPTAFEGWMLNKWVNDEAGKQKDLPQMWRYTEECLRQETRRIGIPILFGTSGEVGKEGAGLRSMWKNADVYRLKRFFFAAWNGLIIDEFGNDDSENAIRWVLYERERLRNVGAKEWNDFVQQYPLTVDEAFSIASTGGVGNIIKINAQLANLREEPPLDTTGNFILDGSNNIVWKPSPTGKVVMYENRLKDEKNLYNAGCDPADHDDVTEEASDLSLIIQRKQHGILPPQIVLDYTDRPEMASTFYDQAALALLYYNETKVLIENNRFRMISHFDERSLKYLMSTTPQGISKLMTGKTNQIGIRMNEFVKEYMEGLIEEYIDEYWEFIPSEKILDECVSYGSINTDRVMAWGICLIQSKEDKTKVRNVGTSRNIRQMPGFVKEHGKIVRI